MNRITEQSQSNCNDCTNPEECRNCVYQTLYEEGDYEKSLKEFLNQYFSSVDSLDDFYGKMIQYSYYTKSKGDFYKKYACDLDWAKQTEYCKVAPEAPKTGLFPVTEDDRTKIIGEKFSEYPCIHDLPLYLNRKADGTVSYFLYFEIGDYKAFYYPKGRVVEVVGDKKEVKKYQCPTSNETSKTPTSYDDDVSNFLGSKTS